jgi:hypothetical protein
LPTPFAIAALSGAPAIAVVFGPIPRAKPPGALVQPPPLPNPLMDAQVAFAVPEPLRAAAAKPAAVALSNRPPVSFDLPPETTLLLFIDLPPKVKMYCLAT